MGCPVSMSGLTSMNVWIDKYECLGGFVMFDKHNVARPTSKTTYDLCIMYYYNLQTTHDDPYYVSKTRFYQ